MPDAEQKQDEGAELEPSEQGDVEEHRQLKALVIYEVVRREGDDELSRPTSSLWWSGLTAGLGMGFSLAAEGALHAGLPDAPWRPLVENFGYTVGFLIVILSRHQLFTENTLTAVLPVLHPPMGHKIGDMLRLWTVVFIANLVGTALFAAVICAGPVVAEHLRAGIIEVARELGQKSASEVFWRAIPAGWLIATLVWMLPSAETGRIWVIIAITYLIALFELTHVIAGAAEVFLLVYIGDIGLLDAGLHFLGPMLVGNVIGGSALFAMLSFGQVKEEIG